MDSFKVKIAEIYDLMEKRFGDLEWWPADNRFEIIIGAVLTQNTNWKNVERSLAELKGRRLLSVSAIREIPVSELAGYIRSSGYFRQKSVRLKEVCEFIARNKGIAGLAGYETDVLRQKLLDVNGIGPETADSILLYAFDRPVFVVDAYTKRIFSRHGLVSDEASYDELQKFVHDNFPGNVKKLNQLHAMIVETGKNYCKKKEGLCGKCPLGGSKAHTETSPSVS